MLVQELWYQSPNMATSVQTPRHPLDADAGITGGVAMISAWHLLWIIPLVATISILVVALMRVTDDGMDQEDRP